MLVHYMSLQEPSPPSDPKFSVASRHVMSSAVVPAERERVYATYKKKCYSSSEKSHKIRICDQMKGVAMKI